MMGTFRIEIQAVGGHGCQREAEDGDVVTGCARALTMAHPLLRPPLMDTPGVEARISQKLENGELPRDEEDRTWAGPGLDLLCSACGRPITAGETEVELDFTRVDGVETFRFHRQCYTLWEVRKEIDC